MLNYKTIEEVDLKLGLQDGGIIKVDSLEIKPYILREIRNYGYTNYMKNLQWLSLTVDDFIQSVLDEGKRVILEEQRANLKPYDFYSKLGGQDILESLMGAMAMIFRTEDIRILDDGVIAIDFMKKGIFYEDEHGEIQVNQKILNSISEDELTVIHKDNFDDIVEVIKLQNYLSKPKKKDKASENPVDDETRRLMEDMERHRQRVEAKKNAKKRAEQGDDDNIDISDIVSAVSSKSNSINKLNIWDLTLYQIYDEYARLELIDNYDFSIKAMMAGAEKNRLKALV